MSGALIWPWIRPNAGRMALAVLVLAVLVLAVLVLTGLLATGAQAHPLGNNTVNRAADIEITAQAVRLRYLLDLAEIPTLLAAAEADGDGDGTASEAEWDALVRGRGEAVAAGVALKTDGRALGLALEETAWRLSPGAAGLTTLRIELGLTAQVGEPPPGLIEYADWYRPEESGWKEVVARAAPGGRILESDVPSHSPSAGLSRYPDPQGTAAQVLAARIRVEAPPSPRTSSGDLPRPVVAIPRPQASALPPTAAPAGVPGFFRLGVHHIAIGLDHLVFLLGLIAAERSLRRLAWIVTAFTAAHSISLALAAGGLLLPPAAWVEPAIGLTILYVGIANLRGGLRHGAGIAFGFGLVHGFGFAGALAGHLDPASGGLSWLLDLAAFNLGVEAGQLAFVLAVLLLHRSIQALPLPWPPWVKWLPGGVVVSLGAFWTIQRAAILLGIPGLDPSPMGFVNG